MMNSKNPNVVPIDTRLVEEFASLLCDGFVDPNPSLPRHLEFCNGIDRVDSFALWPAYYHQHPSELAEAGFFSCGVGDRVTCFHCGKTLVNWMPEDEPWEEHARHSPRCQWLLAQKGKIFVDKITNKYHKSTDSVDVSRVSLDGLGGSETEDQLKYLFAKNPNYCSEGSRRETFNNWSLLRRQSPHTLAQAGFFSLRVGDHVQCFYCGIHLSNWEPQDEPWEEHARHSPDCKWLLEQKGRLFIDDVRKKYKSSQDSNKNPTKNRDGDLSSEDHTLNLLSKFPSYCTPDKRRASFLNWPVGHRQKPYSVAEAGFFSCGIGDRVTCFYCGATLVNWDPNDEPWEEHARHSPKCKWLIKQKGQEFVNQVAKKYALEKTVHVYLARGYTRNKEVDNQTQNSSSVRQKQFPTVSVAGDDNSDRNQPLMNKATAEVTQKMKQIKLEEESSSSGELEKLREKLTCKICLDNDLTVVFHPCKHMIACTDCADKLQACPICRTNIQEKVQVFLS